MIKMYFNFKNSNCFSFFISNINFINNLFFNFGLEFTQEATYTMTIFGKFKLIDSKTGFEYHQTSRGGAKERTWECSKRRRMRCKGKARTCKIGSKEMAYFYDKHNHDPMQNDEE